MQYVYKVLTGREDVDKDQWFIMASVAARTTRVTAHKLNVRVRHGRLDVSRNFFSVRVAGLMIFTACSTRDKTAEVTATRMSCKRSMQEGPLRTRLQVLQVSKYYSYADCQLSVSCFQLQICSLGQ